MKKNYQKGCVAVWITIIMIVLIAGGIYFYSVQNHKIGPGLPSSQEVANQIPAVQSTTPTSESLVSGNELIKIYSPKSNSRVNASQPIVISGQARKVYELGGEFTIDAYYTKDNATFGINTAVARCVVSAKGCNDLTDNFVDFTATLDVSQSPVCSVILKFYPYNRITKTQPFFTLPLQLYGNSNCK